jgi:hypothetical protein
MNDEQLRAMVWNGPQNIQQTCVLLTLAMLSDNDCIVHIENKHLLHLINISSKNLTYTINELIKKGFVELLRPDAYRINPSAGLEALIDRSSM